VEKVRFEFGLEESGVTNGETGDNGTGETRSLVIV